MSTSRVPLGPLPLVFIFTTPLDSDAQSPTFPSTVMPVVVAILIAYSLRRNNPPNLIGVVLGALVVVFGPTLYLARSFMGLANAPWWGFQFFRGRDSDWFVAQGYARRIFVDTSLNGGENLFYFQPATRYLVFIQHLLFGENDILLGILMAVSLLTAAVFAARETLKYLLTSLCFASSALTHKIRSLKLESGYKFQ